MVCAGGVRRRFGLSRRHRSDIVNPFSGFPSVSKFKGHGTSSYMKNQFFWPQAERPTDRPLHGFFFGIVVRLTTFLFPPTVCFFATVTKDDGITQLNDFTSMSIIEKFKV